MGLLLTVIQYLVDAGLCKGDGEDCYRDFMPEEPSFAIGFHEYKGDALSPFTASVHRSIQVKVRDLNAEVARAKAVQICKALRSDTEDMRINFSDEVWGQVYIRQAPFKLLQDESGRVTYCFNLGITTNILE